MALTMRPTGLGAGVDKDRQDFTVEPWRVNSPFSVLAGRTRVQKQAVRAWCGSAGWLVSRAPLVEVTYAEPLLPKDFPLTSLRRAPDCWAPRCP